MFQPGHYYGGGWPKGRPRNRTSKPGRARGLILAARAAGWSWRELDALFGCVVSDRELRRIAAGDREPNAKVRRVIIRKLGKGIPPAQ